MKSIRFALVILAVFASGPGYGATIDPERSTVLVTGSNRGIGLAFVKHYVNEGWNVLATTRSPARATELNALAAQYEHLLVEQLDVTDGERITPVLVEDGKVTIGYHGIGCSFYD